MNPPPESTSSASVDRVLASDATKADKIRRLDELGMSRADIARAIGVRYQYVRNVLVEDERLRAALANEANRSLPAKQARRGAQPYPANERVATYGVREASLSAYSAKSPDKADDSACRRPDASITDLLPDDERLPVWRTIAPGGVLQLPEWLLEGLGVGEGDRVCLRLEAGGLRVINKDTAIKLAQQRIRELVPPGVSLVDELFAERRREAELEEVPDDRVCD